MDTLKTRASNLCIRYLHVVVVS